MLIIITRVSCGLYNYNIVNKGIIALATDIHAFRMGEQLASILIKYI